MHTDVPCLYHTVCDNVTLSFCFLCNNSRTERSFLLYGMHPCLDDMNEQCKNILSLNKTIPNNSVLNETVKNNSALINDRGVLDNWVVNKT